MIVKIRVDQDEYHKLSAVSSLLRSFMSFCWSLDSFFGTFILNFII